MAGLNEYIGHELKILRAIERVAGPSYLWSGRCHEIATAAVGNHIISGKVRFGHWTGPVSMWSIFSGRLIVQHGWIELDDGGIIDPTRFVFEDEEPYIYIGENDHYDAGGNLWILSHEKPPPKKSTVIGEKMFVLDLPIDVAMWLTDRNHDDDAYSMSECFWLANLSLTTLGEHAKKVYDALINADLGALIPIDNREIIIEKN